MMAGPFVPFTGYDPLDGDDPRVALAHHNPLRLPRDETPRGTARRRAATGGRA